MPMNQTTSTNTPHLIHHFLEESAKRFPNKTALIHGDVRATYSQINSQANQLAHWLVKQGIIIGDRVVLIMENCLEYVVSYYGILKAGAVAVPLSSDLKPDGLEPLLAELEAKAILLSHRYERLLNASNLELIQNSKLIIKNCNLDWSSKNVCAYSWDDVVGNQDISKPDIAINETALAGIIYTSGSTGTPKGVMLSHRNVVSNVNSICRSLAISHKDIQMIVLPFFYVMGKSLLNTHFAAGGRVVINNQFAYPASVIKQMLDEKVTAFSGVPATYAYLLHRSPLEKHRDKFLSLRYCSQAGGHMSKTIKQKLRNVLPDHTQIYIMYGATEASARLTCLMPGRFMDKIESIGKQIKGVTMRILDENGVELPVGQKGELVASGDNIMQGYWLDELTTSRVLDQNGYHTGDLGYQDDEGYFYVEGRKDNLIKVGGNRINPQEIEDALLSTHLLVEAFVIGVPDDLLGNKLIALAVLQDGDFTANRILELCSKKLPKYKMPAQIKLVRALPKNANRKIDRSKCLKLANN